jgi:hypothetical protein
MALDWMIKGVLYQKTISWILSKDSEIQIKRQIESV